METYEGLMATIALTMGASWASGINLYAALLVLGIGGSTGNIALPEQLHILQDPMVIGAAGLMYFIEFFADKTPGVDSGWDVLHTFVRIPAGAMLAAGAVGEVAPAMEVTAGILGGTMAATSHAAKAGTRALINTSPEPFTNWGASISEDVMVLGGMWAALNHPGLFIVFVVAFVCLVVWLLPKLLRAIAALFRNIGRLLGLTSSTANNAGNSGINPLPAGGAPNPAPTQSPPSRSAGFTGDGGQSPDRLGELERLQELRNSGALTEQEFQTEKQRILRH